MQRQQRWANRAAGLTAAASLMVGMMVYASRPAPDPAVREGVSQLAGLIEKNDAAGAEKLTAELSTRPFARNVMSFFGGTIAEVSQKGVTDKDLADHADDYKKAGYEAAAVGMLLRATGKETDAKKQADWVAFTKELQTAGVALAEAAAKKAPAAVKAAAVKADGACTKCHEAFRPRTPAGVIRTG